ncbi:hypothetical protein [Mesorhizobium sp. M1273]|uniref:hypothetical protein n=1 Tax=Mesorhizobium sp. M1273 TaxID=2957075 RepID=UPI00333DCFF6
MSPKAAQVAREIEDYFKDRPVEDLLAFREWMRGTLHAALVAPTAPAGPAARPDS